MTTNNLHAEGEKLAKPFDDHSVAAKVVSVLGSWPFVLGQTTLIVAYILWNLFVRPFDVYPFILLNLCLSLQAAYAGPLILMAQNKSDQRAKEQMRVMLQLALKLDDEVQEELEELEDIQKLVKRE